MHLRRVTAVAFLALLAGCTSPVSAAPVDPTDMGAAWSQWDGPYAAMGFGYGFVAIDEDGWGPPIPITGVDNEGRVLWVMVAVQQIGGEHRDDITFASGLEGWRPIVTAFLQDRYLTSNSSEPLRVDAVKALRLSDTDADAALDELRAACAIAQPPKDKDPNGQVVDAGTAQLMCEGKHAWTDPNVGDAGWDRVEDQMDRIRVWAEAQS